MFSGYLYSGFHMSARTMELDGHGIMGTKSYYMNLSDSGEKSPKTEGTARGLDLAWSLSFSVSSPWANG